MSASSISALLSLTLAGVAPPPAAQAMHLAPLASPSRTVVPIVLQHRSLEGPQDPNGPVLEAQTKRQADSSAENWEAEGDALAAKGDEVGAISAYTEARARQTNAAKVDALDAKIDALHADGATVGAGTEVVEASATVAVQDSGVASAETPATASDAVGPSAAVDARVQREPVITKWYFWVTVVAITASAGAIAGIAAKAAVDERKATRSGVGPGPNTPLGGPALLRF